MWMNHVKNLTLKIDNTELDYARFGNGSRPLVLIPGLSLKEVKGAALPLAYMYRLFAKEYTVYIFDKKAVVPEGYTIRDMVNDAASAMEKLNICNADIFGVSQGGMIAQYLAIDHPRLVHKLVLGVTASRCNEVMEEAVNCWIELAGRNEYEAIVMDMLPKMYSETYIQKYQWLFPVLSKTGKPKDFSRFITLARACLTCNAYPELDKITCPVFVIGGKQDRVVTGRASEKIAEKLGCGIYLYDHLGHAAYEEAKNFKERIYQTRFLIASKASFSSSLHLCRMPIYACRLALASSAFAGVCGSISCIHFSQTDIISSYFETAVLKALLSISCSKCVQSSRNCFIRSLPS